MSVPFDKLKGLFSRRRVGDLLLLGVTVTEFAILVWLTPTFAIADWIYVLQHLIVMGVALTRRPPTTQDQSLMSSGAVVVAYAYSYAQVIYLRWVPGEEAWPAGGFAIVLIAACLSFVSLVSLGRRFGVRPAWRGLATQGPYRLVRHPMYLSYFLSDIGYNLLEWNDGTALMVLAGWAALLYRIHAEERQISQDPQWGDYAANVRYRLVPGVW